jgi:hypothetical protein
LLLGFCPFPICPLLIDAESAQEAQTGVSRVSGNLSQLCDQPASIALAVLPSSVSSFFVFPGQFRRLVGPLERPAFAHTFVFPHTADFRRPALVECLRPTPRKKLLRLSKEPPLSRQKGTQSCLEICTQTTVAKLNSTSAKGQRIHDFRAPLKIFFLAENRAKAAPRAQELRVL